jgi:NAD(P)-dependent dehydrogenase (short-subunit alcohol dehydrogenase family)
MSEQSSDRVQFDFSDCRVLVTGGSSGIGHGIASAFAAAKADVLITGRRAKASEYDVDLSAFRYQQLEMTDSKGITALADGLDGLDILVNNAGLNLPGGQNEYIPEVFEEVVAINLFGSYRMVAACKEKLSASHLEGGASVINLASMSSFFAVPIVPGYGAAKAAIVQMTKNLAVAWVGDGIRVNAVAPGLIESNMTAGMKGVEVLEKPQMERTPMGRWGTPQDIAPAVLFLSSPAARFITGQTLPVDGGYSVS